MSTEKGLMRNLSWSLFWQLASCSEVPLYFCYKEKKGGQHIQNYKLKFCNGRGEMI